MIVPLFSWDNMIKCAFLGVILAARRFKWHISLVIRCKTHVCHVPSVVNDLWSQNYRAPLKTRQHTMLLSNEGVRKAIASFYRDDSATVFLGLLTIFVPKTYLPTFSESNAWDFHLVVTEISGNVPATSKYSRRISEYPPPVVWALPKLLKKRQSQRALISLEHKKGHKVIIC